MRDFIKVLILNPTENQFSSLKEELNPYKEDRFTDLIKLNPVFSLSLIK